MLRSLLMASTSARAFSPWIRFAGWDTLRGASTAWKLG